MRCSELNQTATASECFLTARIGSGAGELGECSAKKVAPWAGVQSAILGALKLQNLIHWNRI